MDGGSIRVTVSVPMTLSDLERRDMRGQNFQADLLNNALTCLAYNDQIRQDVGRGVFLAVQPRPYCKERCPSAPQF